MICKFCRTILPEELRHRSHTSVHKDCYRSLQKYKRLITKTSLDEEEALFVRTMEKQFEVNKTSSGLVPAYYTNEAKSLTCIMCGKNFETKLLGQVCPSCKTRENAYRSLCKYSGSGYRIHEHEQYYTQMAKKGFKVPEIYWARKQIGLVH